MLSYNAAEILDQVSQQPLILKLWLYWLIFINFIPALYFSRKYKAARPVLAAILFVFAVNLPLMFMTGFSKLLALSHLLV